MKEKIKSIGIAAALVLCVAVTACDNNNTEKYDSYADSTVQTVTAE